MPPKRQSKITSVLDVWAKQQANEADREERKRPFETREGIGAERHQETDRPPKLWTPLTRRSSTLDEFFSSSSHIESSIEYTSTEKLKEIGYDEKAGQNVLFPAAEFIRLYELSILKKCLAGNTCISLPVAVDPIPIVVLTFVNFARWFPRSRAIFCCNTLDPAEYIKSVSNLNGFSETEVHFLQHYSFIQVTIIRNFQNFKKPKEEIGRIIISTPQCLQKIVESDSPILSEIRCIAICMEPNEAATKYTKFVGPLTANGFFFRLLTIIPHIPDHSIRTAAITKRQQVITSLFISEWEEPPVTDLSFRRSAVPYGVLTTCWKNLDQELSDLVEMWGSGSTSFLVNLSTTIELPSLDINDLLNFEWDGVQREADSQRSKEIGILCRICSFLVLAYRTLFLFGMRVFYLYCTNALNDVSTSSISEQIQITILNSPQLSKVFEKAQKKYSYNNDLITNVSFNELTLLSHPKFKILRNKVEKYLEKVHPVRGLILCESIHLSKIVCECLSNIGTCQVMFIVPKGTEIRKFYNARPINNMSGLYFEPKNVILVLSLDLDDALSALDTATSNQLTFIISMGRRSLCLADIHKDDYEVLLHEQYEKLRESDGRIIQQIQEQAVRRRESGRVGAVNKYSFKFEPSRLSFNMGRKRVQFILNIKKEMENRDLTAQQEQPSGGDKKSNDNSHQVPKSKKRSPKIVNPATALPTETAATIVKYNKKFIYDSTEDRRLVAKYDLIQCKLDRLLMM